MAEAVSATRGSVARPHRPAIPAIPRRASGVSRMVNREPYVTIRLTSDARQMLEIPDLPKLNRRQCFAILSRFPESRGD